MCAATMHQIQDDHLELERILGSIDNVNNAILQKHEADFIEAYKDHMLKVQVELLHFKKKSSDFFLEMKKNEKLKMLEHSVKWLRDESVTLASNIEELKDANRGLRQKLRIAAEEKEQLHDGILSLTHHNRILKDSVKQLKSPALIAKYEK